MSTLNSDQFGHVFSQLETMDHEYPTPAYQEHKDTPLFHGTTHNITDGTVRPANDVGKNVSEYSLGDPGDLSKGDHAFTTHDENYAWQAANIFHKNGRRPRVYETSAVPDMKPGPWNKDHPDFLHHHEVDNPDDYDMSGDDAQHVTRMREVVEDTIATYHQPEFASPTGFPVRKRIDIMPGRQGTFPDVNWNRVKKEGPSYGADANHPSDEQIQYGVYGQQAPDHRYVQDAREAVDDLRRPKRTGASLRAFMMGKPDPGPLADHPHLF